MKIHITNVIFNLLDNAMKYSKEIPEIKISTENKKEGVLISVSDKGIGISKEHHTPNFRSILSCSYRKCSQCKRIWFRFELCKKNC